MKIKAPKKERTMPNIVTKAISTVDKYWKCPPIEFNVRKKGERNENL